MNSPEIKQFIKENASLFWWINEDEKKNISLNLLVEAILNYGDEKTVKRLFELVGLNQVAEIFYKHTTGLRSNYFPRTQHFFNLYFQKHTQGNTH